MMQRARRQDEWEDWRRDNVDSHLLYDLGVRAEVLERSLDFTVGLGVEYTQARCQTGTG